MQNLQVMHSAQTVRFLADDKQALYVHVIGSGPPIVMLHGWTADHTEWQLFIKELSKRHQLFLWDARGHGGHAVDDASRADVQRMAQDLRCLLAHFSLNDVCLVGHSMGALTAWEYMREFDCAHLSRLCVIDQSPKLMTDDEWSLGIFGDFDVRRAAQFEHALHSEFAETVLRLSALSLNARARKGYEDNTKGWQHERRRLQQQMPAPLISIWRSLMRADYRDVLAKIDIPTLLIYGAESNFYLTDTANYVAERIANSELFIYENTDHCPHLWQPARFISDLSNFIVKTSIVD